MRSFMHADMTFLLLFVHPFIPNLFHLFIYLFIYLFSLHGRTMSYLFGGGGGVNLIFPKISSKLSILKKLLCNIQYGKKQNLAQKKFDF